jgi:hypothetical protein
MHQLHVARKAEQTGAPVTHMDREVNIGPFALLYNTYATETFQQC